MVCIKCQSRTKVCNSRLQKRANAIWRRRKCLACRYVFTTQESLDTEKSWVVQYSTALPRPFTRDTLFISVFKSLQHRPSATGDATALTATIITQLPAAMQQAELTSTAIAIISLQVLQRFDVAAATFYQAYHGDVL